VGVVMTKVVVVTLAVAVIRVAVVTLAVAVVGKTKAVPPATPVLAIPMSKTPTG